MSTDIRLRNPEQHDIDGWMRRATELDAEVGRLRAEVEALRKDAERYLTKRWLDAGKFVKTPEYMRAPPRQRDMMLSAWELSYDAAVDAAMAKEKP